VQRREGRRLEGYNILFNCLNQDFQDVKMSESGYSGFEDFQDVKMSESGCLGFKDFQDVNLSESGYSGF
jgi:hypothetical protein